MESQSSPNPVAPGEAKPVSPVADDVLAELSTITDEPSPADAPAADTENGDKPVPSVENAERAVEAAEALPVAKAELPKFDGATPFESKISDSSGVAPDLSSDAVVESDDISATPKEAEAPVAPEPVTDVPDEAEKASTIEVFTGSDIAAPETTPETSVGKRPGVSPVTSEAATQAVPAVPDMAGDDSVTAEAPAPKDAAPAAGVVQTPNAVVATSAGSDKRTVFILSAIAIVLLVAIAVLYFV